MGALFPYLALLAPRHSGRELETKSKRWCYTHIMKKSLLLLIAVCGPLLAGCSTAHHATRWEYRQTNSLTEVNQLAGEGWTVVNFAIPGGGPYEYLLKRAKR